MTVMSSHFTEFAPSYNLFKLIHHQNKSTFEHLNILQSFLKQPLNNFE